MAMMNAPAPKATLLQINVNPEGGVPKYAVESTTLTSEGVLGDRQLDLEYHGGPQRAVCLFAVERIDALAREGHPITPGSTGENLTLSGVDWSTIRVGSRLQIGAAVIEITGPAPPCKTIADSFVDGEFVRISAKLHPHWSRLYAAVIQEGEVRAGDSVIVLDEPRQAPPSTPT